MKKADRHPLSRQDILEFRIKQMAENAETHMAALKKGKRRARDSPDAGEPGPSVPDPSEPEPSVPDRGKPEPSAPVPSPSVPTASLGALTLDSSASSAANTPGESPITFPQHPPPLHSSPAPPTALEACHASNCIEESPSTVHQHPLPQNSSKAPPTAHLTSNCLPGKSASSPPVATPAYHLADFVVEVPSAPQYLRAAHRQALCSCSDTSLASDDGSFAAMIAMVEKKQEQLEKWMHDIDNRMKQLEK